ncbi:mandelate racemase/muconate lactonizing enzyme family protein [Mangrovicella endophytica]|uniref:mandelate racemase/muconate lactonizing enzyme family protein n=1 Tax=Mangrovicella endophytica TaxID=2066697 RepID=UPI000C9E9C51|nr:mandelate racemase/muconate lactonizing enzyme family protein [Mangrovicella endophytica]
MRISAVDFVALSVPLGSGKAYGMSKSLSTGRQSTLVRVTLDNGVVGYGEAWGIPAVNKAFAPLLSGYLVGADVFAVEHVFERILARHYHFGLQGGLMWAISGLDIAAKDAMGKVAGVSVADLIGGRRTSQVPTYMSGGYMTETPEADYRPQIEAMAEAGYRTVKIKVGLNPASDEARVSLARELLGADAEILVDINANYTLDLALETLRRLEPYRIGWLEEPLAPQDVEGYAALRKRASVPIAAGEALYTVFDFKRLVDAGGVDILQPDLSLCGGFWQGRKIAAFAHAAHLRVSPHVWGGAVGLAAGLQFIASLGVQPHADNIPKPVLLEYDLGANPLRTELLKTPIEVKDGFATVPDGPGLGIEINEEAVARYAI